MEDAQLPTLAQPTTFAEQDDQALISAISSGDNYALDTLYDRYVGLVYQLARRHLHNNEQAEDIVQEVFWRVWQHSASFESQRGRVVRWLCGITHNLCIDEIRRRRSRPLAVHEPIDHPWIDQIPDQRVDIVRSVWVIEQRHAIAAALLQLPAPQRQVVELAYFSGLSQQEIASRLNSPLGTVKTRVRLGLRRLRSLLAAGGLQLADVW